MTALPVLWTLLLGVAAWRSRPPAPRARAAISLAWLPTRIGALALRAARREGDAPRLGRAIVAGAVTLPVMPAAVPAVVLLVWAAPAISARRARRARADAMLRSLPEVVDLFHLAVASGMTVPLAVDAVVRRGSGPLVDELATAIEEVRLGRRLGDALAEVPRRAGEATRPLVAALVASDRYGAPLASSLARLAGEVRADRRRRAEDLARRVPVKLLFPLVCCVLPAFGLLTLAPLIAGAAAALRL